MIDVDCGVPHANATNISCEKSSILNVAVNDKAKGS